MMTQPRASTARPWTGRLNRRADRRGRLRSPSPLTRERRRRGCANSRRAARYDGYFTLHLAHSVLRRSCAPHIVHVRFGPISITLILNTSTGRHWEVRSRPADLSPGRHTADGSRRIGGSSGCSGCVSGQCVGTVRILLPATSSKDGGKRGPPDAPHPPISPSSEPRAAASCGWLVAPGSAVDFATAHQRPRRFLGSRSGLSTGGEVDPRHLGGRERAPCRSFVSSSPCSWSPSSCETAFRRGCYLSDC